VGGFAGGLGGLREGRVLEHQRCADVVPKGGFAEIGVRKRVVLTLCK